MSESGIDRLASLFAAARSQNRAVLLPYLTAGIPSVDESIEMFKAMADAGAGGFEVGIPYSDPLMDGPVIMEAGEVALANGVTVDVAFEVIRRVVDSTGKPVLAMTYVNPVLRKGVTRFFDEAAGAGASGVIIADLPADEAEPFMGAARGAGIGLALFVAPTTDEKRLKAVLAADPAFVYAVAEVGVTGERDVTSANTATLATKVRKHSDVPIVFGVGISTPTQARAAARHGDGVIVGTAIVRKVLEAPSADVAAEQLSAFVSALSASVHRENAQEVL